jgi:hypothetical protein
MNAQAPSGRGGGPIGETWLRFGLLVIAAFASAVSIGVALWFAVYNERANRALQTCAAASDDPATWSLCGLDDARHRVAFGLLVGAAVVLVALAAWAVQARARRNGLQAFPLPPVLQRAVTEPVLDATNGRRPPSLVWRPDRPTAMARADGVARPYIEVGPNWAVSAVRDPAAARAVLLHELHHVRSRDVVPSGTAYWLGPVVGLLGVGYLVQLVISTTGAPVLDSAIRVGVIVLVIAVGRAAVLRSREHEADLAAARTEPEGIRRLMGAGAPMPSRFGAPFHLHPSRSDRAAVIDRPWLTLQPGPGDGILVGFSAAVGGQVLAELWRTWSPGQAVLLGDLAGWGVAGAVLGAWVTAMLLRSESVPVAGRRARLLVFTGLTALAASVGRLLFDAGIGLPIRWPEQLVFGLLGVVALWCALQALVVWIRAAAGSAGSGREGGSRWAGVLIVVGAVLGGLALGNAGTVATFADLIGQMGAGFGVFEGLVVIASTHATGGPALVLAVALILSSALVVVTVRRRSTVPRSRRTVVIGVVAGVVAALIAHGIRRLAADAADLSALALATQGAVTTIIAVGAIAAGTRVALAPQRACLAAGVGSLTTALGTAVLRADPSAVGVVLFTVGPPTLLAALAMGVAAVFTRNRRPLPSPHGTHAVEHIA